MELVYFAADLHLGDQRILKYRPQFSSIEEHDDYVLERAISVSGKRKTLWLLGDCFVGESSLQRLDELTEVYGQVNLVMGNHETDNIEKSLQVMQAFIDRKIHRLVSMYNYKGFLLSHAPVHPQELRDKVNIHGHTHDRPIYKHFNNQDPDYFCVSLEQINYTPIGLTEIQQLTKREAL